MSALYLLAALLGAALVVKALFSEGGQPPVEAWAWALRCCVKCLGNMNTKGC